MLERTIRLDPHDLRTSGAVMLAVGAVLPIVPGHSGVECPLRRLTGIPCPFCGMTTSVEATVRAHPLRAFAANPGGLAAVALAFWLLAVRPQRVVMPAWLPWVVLPALWLFELHRYSII
jgi:hypothetical protein